MDWPSSSENLPSHFAHARRPRHQRERDGGAAKNATLTAREGRLTVTILQKPGKEFS
jgi:hypothetical protein